MRRISESSALGAFGKGLARRDGAAALYRLRRRRRCLRTVTKAIGPRRCGPINRMSDRAIRRGRRIYSPTASAKIALPCCVCKYQSVKRRT